MTAIQSRTALQLQFPAADTKKIQKLNETSFAWKTARVVAALALFVGAIKVALYYQEHTSPPPRYDSGYPDFSIEGVRHRFAWKNESSVTWLGNVTKISERHEFKDDVLTDIAKRTTFASLFGPATIIDCATDVKLDFETCLKFRDGGPNNMRLLEQCITVNVSESPKPECSTFGEDGKPITDESIFILHRELKDLYRNH